MTGQLDLTTGQPALADPDVKLTARQRIALEFIGHHQPVPSDELGAFLHEDRRARGGRGHSSDERCDWCQSEGAQVGAALSVKGLVKRKRGEGGGWVLADARPQTTGHPRQVESAQLGPDDPWPEGF